jgi:hypothetical protein
MDNFNNLFTAKTINNECVSDLIFDKNFDFDNYEYFVITAENLKTLINSFKPKEEKKDKATKE